MSNQTRRVSSKSATKRRAEARRRTREFGRQFFAYFMIAILVLGTISTVILTPGVPVAPAVTPVPTTGSGGFEALITQGDQAVAAGKPDEAVGYYGAYLGQNPGSPDVNLKLARAYIASTPPKYNEASQALTRVITIDPAGPTGPYASQATTLLTEIQGKITPVSSASQTVMTGTTTVTTGAVVTGTRSAVVPGTTITATRPITP